MLKVAIGQRFGLRYLWFKEPTGREEFALAQGHPLALAQALSSLVLSTEQAQFQQLSLSDRDRFLAAIFTHCFGDNIETVLKCQGCGKKYEFGFSLSEFLGELEQVPTNALTPDASGVFTLSPTVRFRLPTVEDELLAAELPPEAAAAFLQKRCLLDGSLEQDTLAVEEQLQILAPLVRTQLGSNCPHCERPQAVDFNLTIYSQRCFERDRDMLTREIHCLASAYRFGYQEILDMPRSVRQKLVSLLLSQRNRGAA